MVASGIKTRLLRLESLIPVRDEHAEMIARLRELTLDQRAVLCMLDDPLEGKRPKPPAEYSTREACEALEAGDHVPYVATTFELTPDEISAARQVLAEKGFIEPSEQLL